MFNEEMNYDFLRNYHIPNTQNAHTYAQSTNLHEVPRSDNAAYINYSSTCLQQPPPPPTALLDYCDYSGYNANGASYTESAPQDNYQAYHNPQRFMPPGKQSHNYRSTVLRPMKRKYNSGGGEKVKEKEVAETTADGKLVIFQGRDTSYPEELNRLIHPRKCDLCLTEMNSMHSAKDHYKSKSHDRNITNWLTKNYAEKGLDPPEVKRFYHAGPSGPEAFHCELCDLKLTSLTHANQHYAGRRHRLVASKISNPSGAGYYNSEGKWVRTGSKSTPIDDKFVKFVSAGTISSVPDTTTASDDKSNMPVANEACATANAAATATAAVTAAATAAAAEADISATFAAAIKDIIVDASTAAAPKELCCKVCNISLTSAAQVANHLNGAKHRRKLALFSPDATTPAASDPATSGATPSKEKKLKSDYSNYRLPSGFYYCSVCNVTMCHAIALEEHLEGKKHFKKADEKAKSNATSK